MGLSDLTAAACPDHCMNALYDQDGSRAALREKWYEDRLYGTETLPLAMSAGVQQYADKTLVFYSAGRTQSYQLGTLYQRGVELAGAMYRLGLRPGDVAAIQVPNWVEGYLVFQAAMIAGIVVLPIIHIYGASEVTYLLRESGARVLFLPDRWRDIEYLERLRDIQDVPDLDHTVVLGKEVPDGCLGWSDFCDLVTVEFPRPELDPDDVAMILFTSGTTAKPKGVLHSHNSLLAELRAGDREGGVNLSPWPAGHIAGVLSILRLYFSGTESVLMDAWDPQAGAELVEIYGVTSSSGTPYHVGSLLEAAARDGRDISSLTRYMIGAAAVPPETVERCERAGITTYRAYGSSEHPTVTSGSIDDSVTQRSQTDGTLNVGCRVRVVDDCGQDVDDGEAGEIVSQGPDQFLGYQRREHNEGAFFPGGWFRTGDIGRIDAEGFLTITDRKKDIIIRGGENIASKEVEDYLAAHPSIVESAVVGAPDEKFGERVVAYLILASEHEITLEAIQQHFETLRVAKQKTPVEIEIVDSLPRTPTGKIKKFQLREKLWPKRNYGPSSSIELTHNGDFVRNSIRARHGFRSH